MILPTWNGVKFATHVLRQRVRREPVRRKLVLSGIISTYFPASAIVFVFFNRISIIVHVNHNVTMIVGELNYECAATRSLAACPRKHVFAFLISLVWARFGKTNAIVKIGGSRGRKSCDGVHEHHFELEPVSRCYSGRFRKWLQDDHHREVRWSRQCACGLVQEVPF